MSDVDRIKIRYTEFRKIWNETFEQDGNGARGGFIGASEEEDLLDDVETLLSENKILRGALEIIKAGDIFPMAYEGGIARDALDLVSDRQDNDKCQ